MAKSDDVTKVLFGIIFWFMVASVVIAIGLWYLALFVIAAIIFGVIWFDVRREFKHSGNTTADSRPQ